MSVIAAPDKKTKSRLEVINERIESLNSEVKVITEISTHIEEQMVGSIPDDETKTGLNSGGGGGGELARIELNLGLLEENMASMRSSIERFRNRLM